MIFKDFVTIVDFIGLEEFKIFKEEYEKKINNKLEEEKINKRTSSLKEIKYLKGLVLDFIDNNMFFINEKLIEELKKIDFDKNKHRTFNNRDFVLRYVLDQMEMNTTNKRVNKTQSLFDIESNENYIKAIKILFFMYYFDMDIKIYNCFDMYKLKNIKNNSYDYFSFLKKKMEIYRLDLNNKRNNNIYIDKYVLDEMNYQTSFVNKIKNRKKNYKECIIFYNDYKNYLHKNIVAKVEEILNNSFKEFNISVPLIKRKFYTQMKDLKLTNDNIKKLYISIEKKELETQYGVISKSEMLKGFVFNLKNEIEFFKLLIKVYGIEKLKKNQKIKNMIWSGLIKSFNKYEIVLKNNNDLDVLKAIDLIIEEKFTEELYELIEITLIEKEIKVNTINVRKQLLYLIRYIEKRESYMKLENLYIKQSINNFKNLEQEKLYNFIPLKGLSEEYYDFLRQEILKNKFIF